MFDIKKLVEGICCLTFENLRAALTVWPGLTHQIVFVWPVGSWRRGTRPPVAMQTAALWCMRTSEVAILSLVIVSLRHILRSTTAITIYELE